MTMTDYRYTGKIRTGIANYINDQIVVLCTKSGKKIGVINNISGFKASHPMNDTSEISFDVYREADGIVNQCWESIKDFKLVYLPNEPDKRFQWYEITVSIDEETEIIKHVTGIHAPEAELSQLNLYEVEINTADDIARDDYEMFVVDGKEYGTVFYNEDHPKASLLHRILADKASHYKILHVDDTLKFVQREFSFNGTSIVDALRNSIAPEVGCLFVFGEPLEDDGDNTFDRTISAYDLMDYCVNCGERGNYTTGICPHCGSSNIISGYGKDTGLFVNVENIAQSISYSSNTDQVKTFFRMTAGDDVMTAAIKNCNPNGSNYLFYFSDDMKEDMSDELRNKLNAYESLFTSYQTTHPIQLPQADVNAYNTLVTKYENKSKDELISIINPVVGYNNLINYDYNAANFRGFLQTTMMPASEEVAETTAQEQIAKLTTSSMSPIGVQNASTMSRTAADSAVESYAKVYIDTSRYRIKLSNTSYSNSTWNGTITVTSLTDEEDTANKPLTITFNNNAETFIKQKIDKAMKQHKAQDIGDISFLKDNTVAQVITKAKNYSLDALSLLDDLCTATMDILIEGGYGQQRTSDTYNIYGNYYVPYWNKRKAIMAEETLRESEIAIIDTIIDDIEAARNRIVDALDLRKYLGNDLYDELMLYRRETEYNNSNFISDGLTDSEVIDKAKEYYKRAQEEIIKSATLQHTISSSFYNLFLIPEFRDIIADPNVQVSENGQIVFTDYLPANTTRSAVLYKFLKMFDAGNWLRIQVDNKVYKLRLTNWEIDYDNPEDLSVEFSDVVYTRNTLSDVQSVLSQAKSMGTTYNATARQASKGNEANKELNKNKRQGLILSQTKLINDVNTQNLVFDEKGLLMRSINDFDNAYSPEQVKIINKGLYYTNDDWETVQAGIGHFVYYDPEQQKQVDGYGVIASTIVGKLILGENLKIFSEAGDFIIDENGLTASNGTASININPSATNPFVISKGTTNVLAVDSSGNLTVKGAIIADTLSAGGKTSATHAHAGLFIDSSGNLTAGSSGQVKINSNGTFSFGGANGISYNGTKVTLGSDITISWNNVTDQPSIPSDSHITQITKNTVTTAYVNALKVTANAVAAENITGTTISGKTISGGTISGSTITGATFKATSGGSSYFRLSGSSSSRGAEIISNESDAVGWGFCVNDPSSGLSMWLNASELRFYMKSGYTGFSGGMWLESDGFHFSRKVNVDDASFVGTLNGNVSRTVGLTLESTGSGTAVFLKTEKGQVAMSGSNNAFIPTTTEVTYLGVSGKAWAAVYAKDTSINSSDIKFKDVLGSIDYAEDLIMALTPIRFMWKNGDHRRTRMGFIAQDVAQSCKDINENLSLVTASYIDDENMGYYGEDVDDSQLIWGISYEQLIAPMVAVIQKQNQRITRLETMLGI